MGKQIHKGITLLEYYAFRPNQHLSAASLVERRRKLGIGTDHGAWFDTRTRSSGSRWHREAWTVEFLLKDPREWEFGNLAQVLAFVLASKLCFNAFLALVPFTPCYFAIVAFRRTSGYQLFFYVASVTLLNESLFG